MGKADPQKFLLPSPLLIEAEQLRRNFYAYAQAAWHIIEPGNPFQDNWHIAVICAHLQAVTEGKISRLIINIPFRMTKTSLVSVLWPTWEWATDPTLRYLTATREADMATRDALASRRVITSPWYQVRWGYGYRLTGDQNAKTRYENDKRGYRIATSVATASQGEGGDRRVIDDPQDMTKIFSDVYRKQAPDWWDNTFSTRFNRAESDPVVVIMQRGHHKDFTGHLLDQGGWEHIVLPMEFDGVRRRSVLGVYDPRRTKGQLLSPNRVNSAALARMKIPLGKYGVSGQLQQAPTPLGGGIIETAWIKLWRKKHLPEFTYLIQSYDTAYKEKSSNDPSACGVWGVFEYEGINNVMLIDAWDDRFPYPVLRRKVKKDFRLKYGGDPKHPDMPGKKVDLIIVEDKSSGISLVQDLQILKLPVFRYDPGETDKHTRLHMVSPLIEAGLVWAPESEIRPGQVRTWASEWLTQITTFPGSEHDEYVDITSQTLLYLRNTGMILADLRDKEDEDEDDVDETVRPDRKNPYSQ